MLRELVLVARPRQWTKNLVSFAALVFAGELGRAASVGRALVVFASLCLLSSAAYTLNDVLDRDEDRAHPAKRGRPVAAGRLAVGAALAAALVLAVGGLALAWPLAPAARGVLGTFLALNLLYSTWLKHVALVDVLAIALGFVLRVQAGIEGIGAPQSAWILLCMFFMALFLGFGKRRSEVSLMPDAHRHRRALGGYSVPLLDMLLGSSATTALVCYSLYAVTVQQNETFLLTLLPVVFGIARYMMIVLVRHGGEDPGEVLTRDGPLIASVLAWAVLCVAVLYFEIRLLPDVRVPRPPTFAR